MGVRVGNGTMWTGKIFMSEKSALMGTVGLANRAPDTRAGANFMYQRHHRILDKDNLFVFYGIGVTGEFGDQGGIGVGSNFGLAINLWKKLNIEFDIFPALYKSEDLDYVPNFGLSLRYIASHN